jgi:hypothetical protein
MFKIAFPWAAIADERAEREYLKSVEVTSEDEVAGNIWVPPGAGRQLLRPRKVYLLLTFS